MMTPEHRAARRSGMGASDVATIVGAIIGDDTIYGEPAGIWLDKLGKLPDPEPDSEEEYLWLGHAHEPTVAARYEIRTGRKLRSVPGGLIRHPKYEHFFYSPDRLIVDGRPARGLEIKALGAWSKQRGHWGPDGSTEIPSGPFVQVQWSMHCSGYPVWDVAALTSPTEIRIYEIEYDPELGEYLADITDEWWRTYVVDGTPPPPGSTKMSDLLVKRLYPKDTGKVRAATADELEMIFEDAGLGSALGELKKKQAALRGKLRLSLGDYSAVITPGGKEFSNRAPDDTKVTDWPALVRKLGGNDDDVAQFTKTKPASRRVGNGVKIKLEGE